VLLLDDLHWADADSLAVLELIAQSLESVPLLLLLTSREDESNAPLQRALRVLCRLPSSERVDLRDLGEASVRALLSEQDAEALPCELIREVFSASGGNPLFVVELARLHAQGRLRPALCASRSIPVPERVRDAIELHVAQRSDDCQRSLRYATLLGEEFDPEALAELMELSLERLLVAVSEAEAAAWIGEVVETPGCYRFRHRMYRLALHASFTRADLRRLQARASRMLELRASHGLACGRARNLEHPIGLPASRQARERRP
jgi:predicted ATPase